MGDQRISAAYFLDRINKSIAALNTPVTLMEVCGTHTVALRQEGIHSLLPDSVNLISGPGCPVCVTPTGYVDNALRLIENHDATVTSFGDMLKVPGSDGRSLSGFLGTGKVRIVYSPTECIDIAEKTDGPVVFLGIGFETTVPTIAATFRGVCSGAGARGNLFLYSAMKTVPQALTVLAHTEPRYFDGYILPGHVSVVLGRAGYEFIEGIIPSVITGFKALEMLEGIATLVDLICRKENRVLNAYESTVREHGNPKARAVIDEMFEPYDAVWRGLGVIPGSGLRLSGEYRHIDASHVFGITEETTGDPPGCRCADVIQGKTLPTECALFGGRCTPDKPVGPCMVSSEGTCAAYLRYGTERI